MNEREALVTRTLGDGRVLDLWLQTFGRVRLTISQDEAADGYIEGW